MHLRELKVGDLAEVHSDARGVTIRGRVDETYTSAPIVSIGGFALAGDDWVASLIDDYPGSELDEARKRGHELLAGAHSNIADKLLLNAALDAALDGLQREVITVTTIWRFLWKTETRLIR